VAAFCCCPAKSSRAQPGAANYTNSYVEALILGTPKDQLANPVARKQRKGFSSETIARM